MELLLIKTVVGLVMMITRKDVVVKRIKNDK